MERKILSIDFGVDCIAFFANPRECSILSDKNDLLSIHYICRRCTNLEELTLSEALSIIKENMNKCCCNIDGDMYYGKDIIPFIQKFIFDFISINLLDDVIREED